MLFLLFYSAFYGINKIAHILSLFHFFSYYLKQLFHNHNKITFLFGMEIDILNF